MTLKRKTTPNTRGLRGLRADKYQIESKAKHKHKIGKTVTPKMGTKLFGVKLGGTPRKYGKVIPIRKL